MPRCKLPTVIVLSPALGGAALNSLSVDYSIPSLADILPYAPRRDRADLDLVGQPQARVGYDLPAVL